MSNGFSYQDLKTIPFSTWATHYRHIEARRVDHYTFLLNLLHPKNPQRLMNSLRRMRAHLLAGQEEGARQNLARDPKRLAEYMAGFGVHIERKERTPPPA